MPYLSSEITQEIIFLNSKIRNNEVKHGGGKKADNCSPPKDAAMATEPATEPATLAAAAKPPAPIRGITVPNVGAKAPNPAAIAGAASPIEK